MMEPVEVVGKLTRHNGTSLWILKDDSCEAEMNHGGCDEETSFAIRLAVMPAAAALLGKRVYYRYAPGHIVFGEHGSAEPEVFLEEKDGRITGRSMGVPVDGT